MGEGLLLVFLLAAAVRALFSPICAFIDGEMPTGILFTQVCPGTPIGGTEYAPMLRWPVTFCKNDSVTLPPATEPVPALRQFPAPYPSLNDSAVPDCVTCYGGEDNCEGEVEGYSVVKSNVMCVGKKERFYVYDPDERLIDRHSMLDDACIALLYVEEDVPLPTGTGAGTTTGTGTGTATGTTGEPYRDDDELPAGDGEPASSNFFTWYLLGATVVFGVVCTVIYMRYRQKIWNVWWVMTARYPWLRLGQN